jgi:hypothetical protein
VHSTGLWLSKAVVPRIDGTHKFMGMLQNWTTNYLNSLYTCTSIYVPYEIRKELFS